MLAVWRWRRARAGRWSALGNDERAAIVAFNERHPLEGYRRLTYMMLDQDAAYVAPATTYRISRSAGLLDRWKHKPSKKGTDFDGDGGECG